MMTARHYEMLANAIFAALHDKAPNTRLAGRIIVKSMCVTMMADNPRFNPVKFTEACGLEWEE